MSRVHADVIVDAPIELVFARYAQYERHPEWQSGLLRAELTSGSPVVPGTRGIEVRRVFGQEKSLPYVITDHVPPHRSAFRTLEGPLCPTGTASFTAQDGATLMEFEMALGARGVLRLLSPLLVPLFAKQIRADLVRFKVWVEAEVRHDGS